MKVLEGAFNQEKALRSRGLLHDCETNGALNSIPPQPSYLIKNISLPPLTAATPEDEVLKINKLLPAWRPLVLLRGDGSPADV